MPVATASLTFTATPSGSRAKPYSKSAFTGTPTASAIWRRCSSASSRRTPLSGRASDQACPALVVASASKPICSSATALPVSHGFGITKQPAACSRRKASTRSSCFRRSSGLGRHPLRRSHEGAEDPENREEDPEEEHPAVPVSQRHHPEREDQDEVQQRAANSNAPPHSRPPIACAAYSSHHVRLRPARNGRITRSG